MLHRIGLFRAGLHFLLEASEPPRTNRPPSSATTAATAAAGYSLVAGTAVNAGDVGGNGNEASSSGRAATAVPAASSIAGFGGVIRPTAAVAAAGLDTRDGFMVSCTLLLQRVLAMCAIQRDFDRVVGATLSTLADGEATGARESRRAGAEPAFAPAEAVLQRVGLLGEDGDDGGGGGSTGNKVLSGQALVRLYLMRMLLEIVTLPVAAASRGELSATEGVYVGGVGSPCAREAQREAERAAGVAVASGACDEGGEGGGTQLEMWVDGVPPVVDVIAADGTGLPSPLYIGRQRLFKSVCSRALRPDWFISMLETCQEEVRMAIPVRGFSVVAFCFRFFDQAHDSSTWFDSNAGFRRKNCQGSGVFVASLASWFTSERRIPLLT